MAGTILCVHDDQRALMARSLVLSIAGYEVRTATSEDAAIRTFARYEIDIVIANHSLPFMDGVQLTRLLKEVEPGTGVVILADILETATAAKHADLVLPLCPEPEELLEAIAEIAGRRRPSLVPAYKKAANSN